MAAVEALEDGRVAHTQNPPKTDLAGSDPREELSLTAEEQQLLECYDRLEQLGFELALLRAQQKLSQGRIITELYDGSIRY